MVPSVTRCTGLRPPCGAHGDIRHRAHASLRCVWSEHLSTRGFLGWTFEGYSQYTGSTYWDVTTGPDDQVGINGGLLQRPVPASPAGQGANAFTCTLGVEDYDDTEGNTFGIHQPDPEAA